MAVFVVFLVLLIVYIVVLRYLFNSPTTWGMEFQTFIYGAMCVLSMPYATYKACHPRVTVFLDTCPPRVRFYLEILYIFIFYLPFLVVLLWFESIVAYESWAIQETSVLSAWGPLLWPIKATIPLGAALVLIQVFSELAKLIIQNQGGNHHEL